MDDDQLSDEPDEPSGGSSLPIIVVGVLIGLVIAGAVVVLTQTNEDELITAPPPTVGEPAIDDTASGGAGSEEPAAAENGDAVDLVVAYGRSLTENHALTGELRRPDQDVVEVRRAILDDRAIDEVGLTAAVTEAGETRQCELIDDEWLCTPPLPAFTAEMDVQGFATLLLTESPTYTVFATSADPPPQLSSITEFGPVTCWSMVSDGRVDRARFGAETTMCFHDELGALIGRVTETSAGSDTFVATTLSSEVETSDVEPSR